MIATDSRAAFPEYGTPHPRNTGTTHAQQLPRTTILGPWISSQFHDTLHHKATMLVCGGGSKGHAAPHAPMELHWLVLNDACETPTSCNVSTRLAVQFSTQCKTNTAIPTEA